MNDDHDGDSLWMASRTPEPSPPRQTWGDILQQNGEFDRWMHRMMGAHHGPRQALEDAPAHLRQYLDEQRERGEV